MSHRPSCLGLKYLTGCSRKAGIAFTPNPRPPGYRNFPPEELFRTPDPVEPLKGPRKQELGEVAQSPLLPVSVGLQRGAFLHFDPDGHARFPNAHSVAPLISWPTLCHQFDNVVFQCEA